MSDALAEWTEAELRELLAFAANPACIEVAIEAPRLVSLCTLAIRGLEAERVREETLEECAAIADGWDFGAPISREIRALKRGPSDAK